MGFLSRNSPPLKVIPEEGDDILIIKRDRPTGDSFFSGRIKHVTASIIEETGNQNPEIHKNGISPAMGENVRFKLSKDVTPAETSLFVGLISNVFPKAKRFLKIPIIEKGREVIDFIPMYDNPPGTIDFSVKQLTSNFMLALPAGAFQIAIPQNLESDKDAFDLTDEIIELRDVYEPVSLPKKLFKIYGFEENKQSIKKILTYSDQTLSFINNLLLPTKSKEELPSIEQLLEICQKYESLIGLSLHTRKFLVEAFNQDIRDLHLLHKIAHRYEECMYLPGCYDRIKARTLIKSLLIGYAKGEKNSLSQITHIYNFGIFLDQKAQNYAFSLIEKGEKPETALKQGQKYQEIYSFPYSIKTKALDLIEQGLYATEAYYKSQLN